VHEPPAIRYAQSGDIDIAYQELGEGPPDLVLVGGAITHLTAFWEEASYRRFCERLADFARVLVFDKRGMGLSDHVRFGTLEERMDDIRAVMDSAGAKRAALLGISEGGPLSLLFAAAHPERTQALVMCGGEVKEETTEDWPWGEATRDAFEDAMRRVSDWWAAGERVYGIVPSREGDRELAAWFHRMIVQAASPRATEAFMRMAFDIDAREVVRSIRVPTLVVHAIGDRVCHVENGRWLAREIEGARYVERPGNDHVPWGEAADENVGDIREFLTGTREAAVPDRVLVSLLFTDIVGSTERAAQLGDRRWAEVLARHHERVRREIERHRGREIDTAGDGFFASFDGPARAVRCGLAAMEAVRDVGLELRAGVHTGECEVVDGHLRGMAVHIGARVAARAQPGELLTSRTVRDLVVGSGLAFEPRGTAQLKGVEGEWALFSARG
jgi:class 3 adenylate cyclase